MVVVSIDTVRADALGVFRAGAVTPHLDALAADAAVYTRAFTVVPTTLSSHTALFTGKFPHSHGVPRNGFVVDGANVTLAEALHDAGWRTAGFIGGSPLASNTSVNQGFDVWSDDMGVAPSGKPAYYRAGSRVVDEALAWVDGQDPSDPRSAFLFVHLFDSHAPYWAPQAYLDANGGASIDSASEPASIAKIGVANGLCRARTGDWKARGDVLRTVYYAGVSWTDHQVGRLLHGLAARGVLDGTLLVVLADHGEGFDEHDECWNHGYDLYDETTHVPLLIHGPGVEIGETDRLTSNIDVMPTILDWAGVAVPQGVEGQSFAAELQGVRAPPRLEVFSEATKPYHDPPSGWINQGRRKAVRTSRARLVWDPESDRRELYLETPDPDEQRNRWRQAGQRPENQLLDLDLASWAAAADPLPTTRIDDDATKAALEALGYVDGNQ